MRTLAIELNDAGIAVADAQSVLAIEPGYAVVEGNKIITGRDAVAKARLHPRQASNRFWNALSLERGSAGSEISHSAAELAFVQIDSLWKRFGGGADNAVLVVPGHVRGEALGLGLGLANECGIDVRTILATAVAASVRPYPGRQLLYVDAGLYRVSATLIEQGSEAIVSSEQNVITTGLASLTEGFARRIAELLRALDAVRPAAHGRDRADALRPTARLARTFTRERAHRGHAAAARRGAEDHAGPRRAAQRHGRIQPRARAADRVFPPARPERRDPAVRASRVAARSRGGARAARRRAHRSRCRRDTRRAARC